MSYKLKASDVIEIDDEFLDKISSRIKDREKEPLYYTVEQVAEKTKRTSHTIRVHLRNHINERFHKPCLKGVKTGKQWLVSSKDLKEYLTSKK